MTDSVGLEPFDFRKPSGLPEPVDQRLLYWHRGLASLAPERWSQHMASAVTMEYTSHETMLMLEARREFPDAAIAYQLELGPHGLPTLFVIGRPLVLAMLGQILGESLTALPDDRPLTPIERSLSDLLFEELAGGIGEAWPDQEPLRCQIGLCSDKPQRSRLYALGARVLLSRFQVQGSFGSETVYWLAAQEQIETLLAEADDVVAGQHHDSEGALHARAREIPVQMVVRLGSAELPVADLADLRVGDVILLDQKIDEPLVAAVAGKPLYRGWPGRVGSRQAIQIEDRIS